DLDSQTLSILEDYLEQFPGAVITVSHDRYFLDRTVDHLFAFEGDGQIRHFIGNYSEYLEEKRVADTAAATASVGQQPSVEKQASSQATRGNNRTKKLSYKDQKDWDTIEGKIAALEERLATLKKEIAGAGSDYGKVEKLFAEEQQVTADLEAAVERWAELSALIEELEQGK
ncbi:ABC transporter ATP-binding protein, partial [Mesorhizobium sp. M00.F.Ca.ET.186.01.1.1]